MKLWKILAFLGVMMIVLMPVTSAFAAPVNATPEKPPGPVGNADSGFKKVMGWIMWLTPFTAAGLCTYIAYTGMFGVKDVHKRTAAKENMALVVKFAIGVFSVAGLVYGILAAMGIQ